MVREEFNISENRQFWYRPNPVAGRAFQLLHWNARQGYQPIGDYLLLDDKEDTALTERKVQNLVTLMNGHSRLFDLKRDVGNTRTLFHVQDGEDEMGRKRIMLRSFDGNGASRENALVMIEKEYWSDVH